MIGWGISSHIKRSYLVLIGTFDGVHRGHQKLMARLLRLSRAWKLKPRVLFFVSPPRFYFSPPSAPSLLTTPAERADILRRLGVRDIHFIRFGKHLAETSHVRFFREYLIKQARCGGLLVGPDFAFGKDRLGDIHWLKKACQDAGIRFGVFSLISKEGQKISSTRIRNLLLSGEVKEAAQLLGRPYSIQGRVVRGSGLGRRLGVPTANLRIDSEKLLPRGVYKVRVRMPAWKTSKLGACNIGVRPTLAKKSKVHVEVHIPGFSGNLYGRELKLEFVKKLRDEKKFPSLKTLQAQITKDINSL